VRGLRTAWTWRVGAPPPKPGASMRSLRCCSFAGFGLGFGSQQPACTAYSASCHQPAAGLATVSHMYCRGVARIQPLRAPCTWGTTRGSARRQHGCTALVWRCRTYRTNSARVEGGKPHTPYCADLAMPHVPYQQREGGGRSRTRLLSAPGAKRRAVSRARKPVLAVRGSCEPLSSGVPGLRGLSCALWLCAVDS